MARAHRRFMPLDVPAYLADTLDLDAALVGAYLLLIMHYWQHDGLPTDDRSLARIARLTPYQWKKLSEQLKKFFQPGWKHKRVELEIQRAENTHERKSLAGIVGASKRWNTMARPSPSHRLTQVYKKERKILSRDGSMREAEDGRGSKQAPEEKLELKASAELEAAMKRKGTLQ